MLRRVKMHSHFSLNTGRTSYYCTNVLTICFTPERVDAQRALFEERSERI